MDTGFRRHDEVSSDSRSERRFGEQVCETQSRNIQTGSGMR
jgi:hypothetical protein